MRKVSLLCLIGLCVLGSTVWGQVVISNPVKFLSTLEYNKSTSVIDRAILTKKACTLAVATIGETGGNVAIVCSVAIKTGGTLRAGYWVGNSQDWPKLTLGDSSAYFNGVGAGRHATTVNQPFYNRLGIIFTNPGTDTVWLRELSIVAGGK